MTSDHKRPREPGAWRERTERSEDWGAKHQDHHGQMNMNQVEGNTSDTGSWASLYIQHIVQMLIITLMSASTLNLVPKCVSKCYNGRKPVIYVDLFC